MKITLLKNCLLLNGINKANSTIDLEDGLAERMVSAGFAKKYVEPEPEETKVEADEPAETKVAAKAAGKKGAK